MIGALALLACALVGPQQADASDGEARAARRAAALERCIADLARADAGEWSGWRDAPIPAEYGAALEAYRAGDLVATWALALDCLERHPDHPAALTLAGGVAFRLRRYEDAALAYERFLAHAPDDLARTRHLGHAYYSLGRYPDARAHYDRMLDAGELPPDVARAVHFGRALATWRMGNAEGALRDLELVLEVEPLDAEAWTWRATIAFDEEELGDALAAARRARGLAPFDPRPAFLLARVLDEVALLEVDEAQAAALTAEAQEVRREFDRLAAADSRTRELEARLLLSPRDVELRLELLGLREAVGDPRGTLGEAAALARWAPDSAAAQRVVLGVLERYGREGSAAAHAGLLERRFAGDAPMLRALAAFYGRVDDTQGQLRCGARAAELEASRRAGGSDGGK